MARWWCLFAVLVLAPALGVAGERPLGCDLLASYEYDARAIAPGVADRQVDAAKAVPACREALEHRPDNPRYQFLYGRALVLAGRDGEGAAYLARALESDYAAAALYLAQRGAGDPGFKSDEAVRLYRAADRLGSSRAFALVGWRLVALGDSEAAVAGGYRLLEIAALEGDREAKATLGAHYFFHPRFAPDTEKRYIGKALLAESAADGSVRGLALLNLVRLEEDAYGLIPLAGVGEAQAIIDSVTLAVRERRRDVLIWAHHVVANDNYQSKTVRRLRATLCGTRSYAAFAQALGDHACGI